MKRKIIAKTIETFEAISPVPLTEGDAEEILRNVSGFFGILRRWKDDERRREGKASEFILEEGGLG